MSPAINSCVDKVRISEDWSYKDSNCRFCSTPLYDKTSPEHDPNIKTFLESVIFSPNVVKKCGTTYKWCN